jgi:predicted RNA binding protein YcfA (HicA-like mRNA interferase family)
MSGRTRVLSPNDWSNEVKFSELVRLLENNQFKIVKEKGSIRYYGKPGWDKLIRVDFHGLKEVPTGTCHSILKAAGLK